ncbi:unnamed protein product [Larinioides sclopetarius]|uniref:Uncharacterized protein n=1 Tax=Larinioides sclopetarius TaxID=280406 RepID=A0AAV2B6H3_9ARAC
MVRVQVIFNFVDFINLQVRIDKIARLEGQKWMQKMSGRFIGIIAPMGLSFFKARVMAT